MSPTFKQVDLFGNRIHLCKFCGYPMFPFAAYRCEYEAAKGENDIISNPFTSTWHVDLDAEKRLTKAFETQIIESLARWMEDHPRLVEQIVESRVDNWVDEHTIKKGEKDPQASIISYPFKEAQR